MNQEFLDIFNLYKNDVFRLAYSYTKNVADAEDIAQKVFIKLYKNLPQIKDCDSLKKWCFRVAINECKDLSLSAWKKKIFPITPIIENDNVLEKVTEKNEVLDAIEKLPKKERSLIYLYYYEEYKIKEIAEILNVKETTIQTRLARAREKLKTILEKGKCS